MNWFRSNIRSFVWLALVAFAVQMAVSFGHMHREDFGLSPLAAADRGEFASITKRAPTVPAKQDHHRGSHDNCAICASVTLLASGIPALPPALAAPPAIGRLPRSDAPVEARSAQIPLSFQARAPPIA